MKIRFSIALIIVAVTPLVRAHAAKPNYDSLFANVNGVRIHYYWLMEEKPAEISAALKDFFSN